MAAKKPPRRWFLLAFSLTYVSRGIVAKLGADRSRKALKNITIQEIAP
jgi:hypothetical protein